MPEPIIYTINVADWRRALISIKRDILNAEPVAALERIDRLLDLLESFPRVSRIGNTAKN